MSTSFHTSERRRNSRLPLVISVRERSPEGVVMCVATDISQTGMALKRASDTLCRGPVTLEFSLPGVDGLIRVPARFIRQVQTSTIQMGAVCFESLPESLSSWFSDCVQTPVT